MTQQRNAKEEKTIGSLKSLELGEILVPATLLIAAITK